ncbi:MAG: class I SAM-dependent methyltransferase [Bacteroidetes bacterium]|nr:class I SAM-dependent methyltransferase [Bacteroidota bacterium]
MRKIELFVLPVIYIVISIIIIWLVPHNDSIAYLVLFSGAVILGMLLQLTRLISEKINRQRIESHRELSTVYRQIESLLALNKITEFRSIMPPFRGWAISPDFGVLIMKSILDQKPVYILECGCGVSSLLAGYALQQNKKGKMWSLEHQTVYAIKTREELKAHGINKFVEVVDAELVTVDIKGEDWQWYDLKHVPEDLKFDLVIVDGPPAFIHEKSRFPTLFLLDHMIKPGGIVLIDDCKRAPDNLVVNDWIKEFENYSGEWIETEKGTYLLKKME